MSARSPVAAGQQCAAADANLILVARSQPPAMQKWKNVLRRIVAIFPNA
jgi:hypothetical protein